MNIFYRKHYQGRSSLGEIDFKARLLENLIDPLKPDFSEGPFKKAFRGTIESNSFQIALNRVGSGIAIGQVEDDGIGGGKVEIKILFPSIPAVVGSVLGLGLFFFLSTTLAVMILFSPPVEHRTDYLFISPLFAAVGAILYGVIYLNIIYPRKGSAAVAKSLAEILEIKWQEKGSR